MLQHRFNVDASRSYGLPAEAYNSAELHVLEMERIFDHAWGFVAHASDLAGAGSFVVTEAAGREYLVVRGADGQVRAFDNMCPVRPHPLAGGRGRTQAFRCPRHGIAVSPEGAVVRDGASREDLGNLRSFAVERVASLVFANPDPGAAPLASLVPGLAAELENRVSRLGELVFAARITSDFRANWKVMIDNSVECYHCDIAHPDFNGLLDLSSYRIVNHAYHASHTGGAGVERNSAYGFDAATNAGFAAWWVWPNLLCGPFPGRSNITIHRIVPTGPQTAREHFDFYFLPDGPDEQEQEAIAFFRDVLRPQDIALVESVQRGLNSRAYRDGRLMDDAVGSAMSERNIHLFHGLVLSALGEAVA